MDNLLTFFLVACRSYSNVLRSALVTHAYNILVYAGRIFVHDFGVHAAIFGTERSDLETVFFPFSVENVERHLIKFLQ